MPYNPDRHHRRSIRLKEYDYSQVGLYFVTICVQNHECLFGEIAEGKMILNNAGEMVQTIWNELPQHFQNVESEAFVVMPNHIHGIVAITDGDCRGAIYRAQMNTPTDTPTDTNTNANMGRATNQGATNQGATNQGATNQGATNQGATNQGATNQGATNQGATNQGAINRAPTSTVNGGFANLKNPMFYENLGRILRWFKGRATFECRKIIPYFAWQRNYYENIIRNNNDCVHIVEYIEKNPISWEIDRFYK